MTDNQKPPRPGLTCGAMQAAPRAAIYVWKNAWLAEPRRSARWLRRTDLRIIGPGMIGNALRGATAPVVVDHAAILRVDQIDLIERHNRMVNSEMRSVA